MTAATRILGHETSAIPRRLEEGWGYAPDWRLQLIEAYLVEIAGAKHRADALQTILYRENDPVVRQGLRYRMTGQCAATEAFSWAVRCARDNARTGLISMIGSMVIAGIPTASIAAELATSPFNIVVAERLYFDIRRYLQNRIWLRSVLIEAHDEGPLTPAQSRERMWMTIAFESGPDRLLTVLRGGDDSSDESLEATAQKIEAIAGRRALEYVRNLDREGFVANEDDLKRYLAARSMRSREAATTASEQTNRIKDWGLAVVRALDEQNKRDLDAKTLQDAARVLPLMEIKAVMDRRMEPDPLKIPASGKEDSTSKVTSTP